MAKPLPEFTSLVVNYGTDSQRAFARWPSHREDLAEKFTGLATAKHPGTTLAFFGPFQDTAENAEVQVIVINTAAVEEI